MRLMLRLGVGAFLGFAISSSLTSCSAVPVNTHFVSKMFPSTLRVRRPGGAGADPVAGPGGADYKSAPLPNAQLDCESASSLLRNLHVSKLRECLNSSQPPQNVSYRLRREAAPYLELLDAEKAPVCLRRELPRIPVPREILFQAQNEEGALECFSARLTLELDQKMGFRLPIEKWALQLTVPYQPPIASDSELEREFQSWVLTPIWSAGSENGIPAQIVPDAICKRCLGESVFLKELPSEPDALPTWP